MTLNEKEKNDWKHLNFVFLFTKINASFEELVELSKINQEKVEQLSDLEEQLEIATIEKEMAEEKIELLQVCLIVD